MHLEDLRNNLKTTLSNLTEINSLLDVGRDLVVNNFTDNDMKLLANDQTQIQQLISELNRATNELEEQTTKINNFHQILINSLTEIKD